MALALSFVVKTWLFQAFYIPSGSMENTLVKDDRVIVSKLTPGPFDLKRGDVVVFEDPGGRPLARRLSEAHSTVGGPFHDALDLRRPAARRLRDHLIKRVIGLPGDHVVCCDDAGKLTVNGVAITEPYIKPGDTPSDGKTVRHHRPRRAGSGSWATTAATRQRLAASTTTATGATGSVPMDEIVGRALVRSSGRSTT